LAHDAVRAGIVDQTLSNYLLVEQHTISRAPRINNVSSDGNLQVLYVSGLTDQNLGKFSLLESNSDEISRAVILPLPPSAPTTPGYPSRSIESRMTSVLYEQRPGFIVTLNQGSSSGITKGHLLSYYKKDYIESERGTNIEYPTGSAGTIMIIQTTAQSSLGVVLSARQTPAIDDRVRN